MGLLWVITHFFIALPAGVGGTTRLKKFTYTFGYIVVVLRFFTIASLFFYIKLIIYCLIIIIQKTFLIN